MNWSATMHSFTSSLAPPALESPRAWRDGVANVEPKPSERDAAYWRVAVVGCVVVLVVVVFVGVVGVGSAFGADRYVLGGSFGLGVDRTSGGDVCTVVSGDECGVGEVGSVGGAFSEPGGVAVDDAGVGVGAGDVYVLDRGNGRGGRVSSDGVFVSAFDGSESPAGSVGELEGLAVDDSGRSVGEDPSVGDVYVLDGADHVVDKFSAEGRYLGELKEGV